MIKITDQETIIEFMKIIETINQELKTVYGMKKWINRNGRFVCCISGQLPSLVEMYFYNIGFTKKREPNVQKALNYINELTFMIDPIEYFAFNKEYKNDVTEIIITDDNEIQFNTLTQCLISPFDKKCLKKEYIETGDEIAEIKCKESLVSDILDYNNSVFKMVICLDSEQVLLDPEEIDDESYLSVKLNKKFISGLRNKYKKLKSGTKVDDVSEIIVNLYETEEESKFILKITCNNKNTKVSSYYGVTDF